MLDRLNAVILFLATANLELGQHLRRMRRPYRRLAQHADDLVGLHDRLMAMKDAQTGRQSLESHVPRTQLAPRPFVVTVALPPADAGLFTAVAHAKELRTMKPRPFVFPFACNFWLPKLPSLSAGSHCRMTWSTCS